jgi:acetolactate synthase-1/2/3 large subunit
MPVQTGAALFAETLLRNDIRELFTLVGDHLNDALMACAAQGIRLIDMRHESGCTHAAEAWSRIRRRPAVSLVTGGPGHTNSITGIAAAHLASCPLIAISGAPSRKLAGKGGFQDVDQLSMTQLVTKWTAEPSTTSEIPDLLQRAFRIAIEGRPGPVHLSIPVDLFSASTEVEQPQTYTIPDIESATNVQPILDALAQSQRPVVIAGSGLWWSGTEAAKLLQQFIERLSLPLFTQTLARGAVPDGHPNCFGYADPSLNRTAASALKEADTILVLGKRIDYRLAFGGTKLFSPHARFLQVDIDPTELGRNRELAAGIAGPLTATLRALLSAATQQDHSAWLQQIRTWQQDWRAQLAKRAGDRTAPISPPALFAELLPHIPANALYSWDGGDFVHWGRAMLPANHPGGWLRLGPLAAIGSGLPNALALKLAHPDCPVILFTGDGALGFYLAEIDSLVRHNLPVVIVVGNDAGWGLERELQSTRGGASTVACELRATRYDIITQGFGGDGENITTLYQAAPAFQRALASKVPYCLNVMIRGERSPFTEWSLASR